jgi:hypothetical protein
MRRITLLVTLFAVFLAAGVYAQPRSIGGRRLVIDNGAGTNTYVTSANGLGVSVLPLYAPAACAILDLNSNTSGSAKLGFLGPRVAEVDKINICGGTPPAGMLIYNSTFNYYEFFNGAVWAPIVSGWSLHGNGSTIPPAPSTTPSAVNPGDYFLGTLDAVDFAIVTNSAQRVRIEGDNAATGNTMEILNNGALSTGLKIYANGGMGINVDPASIGIRLDATGTGILFAGSQPTVGIDMSNGATSMGMNISMPAFATAGINLTGPDFSNSINITNTLGNGVNVSSILGNGVNVAHTGANGVNITSTTGVGVNINSTSANGIVANGVGGGTGVTVTGYSTSITTDDDGSFGNGVGADAQTFNMGSGNMTMNTTSDVIVNLAAGGSDLILNGIDQPALVFPMDNLLYLSPGNVVDQTPNGVNFVTGSGTFLTIPLWTPTGFQLGNSYLSQSSNVAGGTLTSSERTIINSTVAGNMLTVNSFNAASTAIKVNGPAAIGVDVDPTTIGVMVDATSVGYQGVVTPAAVVNGTGILMNVNTNSAGPVGFNITANNAGGVGFSQGGILVATNTGTGSTRGLDVSATGQVVGAGGVDGAIVQGTNTGAGLTRGVVAAGTSSGNGAVVGVQGTGTSNGTNTAHGGLFQGTAAANNSFGIQATGSGAVAGASSWGGLFSANGTGLGSFGVGSVASNGVANNIAFDGTATGNGSIGVRINPNANAGVQITDVSANAPSTGLIINRTVATVQSNGIDINNSGAGTITTGINVRNTGGGTIPTGLNILNATMGANITSTGGTSLQANQNIISTGGFGRFANGVATNTAAPNPVGNQVTWFNGNNGTLTTLALTAARTWSLPDETGVLDAYDPLNNNGFVYFQPEVPQPALNSGSWGDNNLIWMRGLGTTPNGVVIDMSTNPATVNNSTGFEASVIGPAANLQGAVLDARTTTNGNATGLNVFAESPAGGTPIAVLAQANAAGGAGIARGGFFSAFGGTSFNIGVAGVAQSATVGTNVGADVFAQNATTENLAANFVSSGSPNSNRGLQINATGVGSVGIDILANHRMGMRIVNTDIAGASTSIFIDKTTGGTQANGIDINNASLIPGSTITNGMMVRTANNGAITNGYRANGPITGFLVDNNSSTSTGFSSDLTVNTGFNSEASTGTGFQATNISGGTGFSADVNGGGNGVNVTVGGSATGKGVVSTNTSTGTGSKAGVFVGNNGATGATNVAMQIERGELTMGRRQPGAGAAGGGGINYSGVGGDGGVNNGPSGIVELPVGFGIAGTFNEFAGNFTINNQYASPNSIILCTVLDQSVAGPNGYTFSVNIVARNAGNFVVNVGRHSNAAAPATPVIRVGYMIVNPDR